MTTVEQMTDSELNLEIAKLLHGEENLVSRPTPYDDQLAWYIKSSWTEVGYFNDQDAIEDYATDLRAGLRDLIEGEGDVHFRMHFNGVWFAKDGFLFGVEANDPDPAKVVCYYFIGRRRDIEKRQSK